MEAKETSELQVKVAQKGLIPNPNLCKTNHDIKPRVLKEKGNYCDIAVTQINYSNLNK
jgi:hypothetical protein